MKQNIVTIDGPSGVGKSTISKKIAVKLGFTYLDTGAMYRAVGYQIVNDGIDTNDVEDLKKCLDSTDVELLPAKSETEDVRVFLFGKDISKEIRTPEMSMVASTISAIPMVREKLTRMQRQIGKLEKIVAEGRDTGTVVFPLAAHKFFLDAKPEIRAKRRVLQLRDQGKDVDEKEILEMIIKRDKNDSERAVAPLKKADDATYIDTSELNINQVVERIIENIKK